MNFATLRIRHGKIVFKLRLGALISSIFAFLLNLVVRLVYKNNLECFYCSKLSDIKYDGQRHWQCQSCNLTNYLDKHGNMTHPPPSRRKSTSNASSLKGLLSMDNDASDAPPLTQKYAYSRNAPWVTRTSSTKFCETCQRNQHLYTQCLAQYDVEIDESSPGYAESEEQYKKYVAELELRYPQVCEKCAPAAYKEIVTAQKFAGTTNYLEARARQDALGRLIDRSTSLRLLLYFGQRCWFAGVFGQLIWDVMVVLTNFSFWDTNIIGNQLLRGMVEHFAEISTSSRWASVSLLLNWVSCWWNWSLEEETSIRFEIRITKHIKEMKIWYFDMLLLLGFRTILYLVLESQSLVDQTSAAPQIMHAFGFFFLVLLTKSAYNCPRFIQRPRTIDLHPPPFAIIGPGSSRPSSPTEISGSNDVESKISMNSSQKRVASPSKKLSYMTDSNSDHLQTHNTPGYIGRHPILVNNHQSDTRTYNPRDYTKPPSGFQATPYKTGNSLYNSNQSYQTTSSNLGERFATPSNFQSTYHNAARGGNQNYFDSKYGQNLGNTSHDNPFFNYHNNVPSSSGRFQAPTYGQNQSSTGQATPTNRFHNVTRSGTLGHQQPRYAQNNSNRRTPQPQTVSGASTPAEPLYKTVLRDLYTDPPREIKPRLVNGYAHWSESPMFQDILKKSKDPSDRALYANVMRKQHGAFADLDALQSSLAEAQAQQNFGSSSPFTASRAANMTNSEAINYFVTGQAPTSRFVKNFGGEPMEIDSEPAPSTHRFNPARTVRTNPQAPASIAAPLITGYNPFRTPVPAAPVAPAHRLRNPPNPPRLRVSSAETKKNFFNKVMEQGHTPSFQAKNEDRREMHLAHPRFFPPSDQRFGDELANAFTSTRFDLGSPINEPKNKELPQAKSGRNWLLGVVLAGVLVFGPIVSMYVETLVHAY